MRNPLMNLVVAVGCTALFLIYAVFLTEYISPGTPRIAVTVALLLVLGALSAAIMNGGLLVKVLFLIAVPAAHIIYEGIDPAKPSLNLLVGVIELVCIWVGAAVGHLASRRLRGQVH